MKRVLLALVPAFALATGCTYSGLPGDLVLGEMSEEEALKLCESTQRFHEENVSAEDRKTYACNMAGMIAGSVAGGFGGDYEETCTEARSECEEEDAEEAKEPDCEDASFSEDCEATVEQFEACQKEMVEEIKKANAEFTCAEPEDDDDDEGDDDDGEESACKTFYKACGLTQDPS